jgi:hypothetical protein
LEQPYYTAIAQLPLPPLLPDLLNPLLSELLLHPGWLVPANHTSLADSQRLHDLRKVCKHVRYQAEFFLPFYGEAFANWTQEIKTLQDQLGLFQDSQVLMALLAKYLPKSSPMPGLQAIVQQTQREVLADWDTVRQRYLDPAFRGQLHQMLLAPLVPPLPSAEPEAKLAPTTQQSPTKTTPETGAKTTAKSIAKRAAKTKTTPKTKANPS